MSLLKNLSLLFISAVVSLVSFELLSRCCLNVTSDNWHFSSEWAKERWLETHENNTSFTTYTFDRYDSLYGWTLQENLEHFKVKPTPSDWEVSSSSKGTRGTNEYPYKNTGKLRILTIGDSFTFGECVGDSDNFPAILETLMDSVEVINLGVHGYGHDQQLLKLANEGIKYHPDIVILGFFAGDMLRNKVSFRDYAKPYFDLDHDTLKLMGIPVPPPDYFLRPVRLKSIGLVKAKWGVLTEDSGNERNEIITMLILKRMLETCNRIDARLMVVCLPDNNECKQERYFHYPAYDSLISQPGVITVDPLSRIHHVLEEDKNPDHFFKCFHYGRELNTIVAEEIVAAIRKENIKRH